MLPYFIWSQNLNLKIIGINNEETRIIDSLGYEQRHENFKSLSNTSYFTSEKLFRVGFISNKVEGIRKISDSTFTSTIHLGKRTHSIGILTRDVSSEILVKENDTVWLKLSEAEQYLSDLLKKFESQGYSLTNIELTNFTSQKNNLLAELKINNEKKRFLNDIVINGYDNFPKSHKKNIMRLFRKKIFNQENLKNVASNFDKFRFVSQTKYPEILFTKDSTKVYVYLEKNKANTFDGYIGFSNDEEESSNITLNGYVDLTLINLISSGETLSLFWKSDGKKQTTFDAKIEIPYVFESPLGIRANLHIFKQDSIFQNTKTGIEIGYYLNYSTRIYGGYQSTESIDILNQNNFSISDFKNYYYTGSFEYKRYNKIQPLFPETSSISTKIGTGKRISKVETNAQYFLDSKLSHHFHINEKNIINIKSHNFYLNSPTYIVNELHRFGGINSIRGFLENSLQGNLFTSLLTEYNYILSPNLYIHSIIDYGYYQDNSNNFSDNLIGLGIGFGMKTNNGLFKINYANGSTNSQEAKFSNSLVHISFITNF